MEPAELIARTAAGTQDFQRVGVSSLPGLSGADAARALSGLDRGPYLLALVMWAGDAGSLYPLQTYLWGELGLAARRDGWKYSEGKPFAKGQQFLRWLACMSIDEMINPRKCGACSGRGTIHPRGGAVRDCEVCGGSGNARVSGRERARLADIPKTSWQRVWAPRYEREGIARLRGWETVMGDHVRKKLRWGDLPVGETRNLFFEKC